MAVKILLLYIIYQMVITASFGGVTPPFSDIVGKVTPVKPKPLASSAIPSPGPSKESPITKLPCNGEEIISKLFSSAQDKSVCREFSSTLELTTSSRPLPVPKIDTSILNEKFSKMLIKKSSTPKVSLPLITTSSTPIVGNVGPDICVPEIPIPLQNPYVSLTNPPSSLLVPSSSDVYSCLSYKPNIVPFSAVPLEPYIKGDDPFSSITLTSLPSVTPNFYSTVLNPELPLLKARKLLSRELSTYDIPFNTNLSPTYSSSYPLPYPLYYKPMYLPNVRTPESPFTCSGPGNNLESLSTPLNVLGSPAINPVANSNSASMMDSPLATPYYKPVNTAEIPKSISPVLNPASLLNTNVINPLIPLASAKTNSVAFESCTVKPPETNLLTSIPIIAEVSSDISSTVIPKIPLIPSKVFAAAKPSLSPTMPLNVVRNPSSPIAPIVPTSCTGTLPGSLPHYFSDFDIAIGSSRHLYRPEMLPIVDTFVETTNTIDTDDLIKNLQARINFNYGPNLNVPEIVPIPLLSEVPAYQIPLLSEQIIPSTIVPEILPPTITDYSARISQSPITYINVSPTSSISQCTSNMVSSINDIVSNIAQGILSSVNTEYISRYIPTNPYNPTLSSSVPVESVPYINTPLIAPSLDTSVSLASPIFETPAIQLVPTQPIKTAIVPLVSPISFSPPRFCPSYLPSPALPSFTTISSPFYMEPTVLKVTSSNKDTKDIDKLLELMLLADFLNGDDNFEWDDLDTLLALLSVR